jgi:hypothetical protein
MADSKKTNFGNKIPELRDMINKYGCSIATPQYVIIGQYHSSAMKGYVRGLIACADNEFYAHILRREIDKSGYSSVEATEYNKDHSKHSFEIELYKSRMRDLQANKKN